MIRSILFIGCLGALFACNGTNKTADTGQRFGGKTEADSLFFSLQRTACFGRCPVYLLSVYRSGYATFHGKANTPMMGDHHTKFGQDVLERVLEEAEKSGFFKMQDLYDSQVTDLPSTVVRVVSGERDKKVVGRYKMPEAFQQFAQTADSLLLPGSWKPTAAAH